VSSALGYGFVLGGLACAAFGAVVGITSGMMQKDGGYPWVRRAVWGFFACMLLANLTMVYALVTHDFSVSYVAHVGSRATPLAFTIVSLWSALEGSILFWGAIMGSYVLAFALAHRRESPRQMQLALGTMMAVGIFFAFLIAGPANPFEAVFPVPPDGPGPNPLLQNDVLMIVHPPLLYLGYVGMVVPFGVAVAALLKGEFSPSWMAPLRRWTLIAWTFLTAGIIVGGWWAYKVLGWGGFWSWDPVENASFLPWLTTSAFIHSTMVHERKGMLKVWTLALALASFVLTILGTFMTRSGIFNSVHAFSQSDIGPTFLIFIALLIVFCFALLTTRAHLLTDERKIDAPVSRETAILVNNLLLVALTFTVLIGTLFPLISEAVRNVRVSVGEPYFNRMAVPGFIAVVFLMGVGPALPWGRPDGASLRKQLLAPTVAGVLTAIVCVGWGLRGLWPIVTFAVAGFAAVVTLRELFLPAVVRMKEHHENALLAFVRSAQKARRRFGGYVVHLGIIMVAVAVAASSGYSQRTARNLKLDEPTQFGRYELILRGFTNGEEPHRTFVAAKVEVKNPSGSVTEMLPRVNYYERSTDPIGTPALLSSAREDLYLSLLTFSAEAGTASLNLFIFPLVGWIWFGIPVIVLGALIAAWPPRRRSAESSLPAKAPASSDPPKQAERGAA